MMQTYPHDANVLQAGVLSKTAVHVPQLRHAGIIIHLQKGHAINFKLIQGNSLSGQKWRLQRLMKARGWYDPATKTGRRGRSKRRIVKSKNALFIYFNY
eukprot:1136169-Pelagomonas_calceolata.AAC.6